MKQKICKIPERITCLAIALVMLLCMLPVFPASAEDDVKVTDIMDADFDPTVKTSDSKYEWTQNADGSYVAPAQPNVHMFLNSSECYTMTDYTFQTDITLPANMDDGTQLGGIGFGILDEGNKTSRYEFTLSYVPAVEATDDSEAKAAGWAPRLYKRATNVEGEASYRLAGWHTSINPNVPVSADKSGEVTFTMKVVLSGLVIKCYVNDVQVISYTITGDPVDNNGSVDANYARGSVLGGVSLISFSNTVAVFSNAQLTAKRFYSNGIEWSSKGSWTYNMLTEQVYAAGGEHTLPLYADLTENYNASNYVFEADMLFTEESYGSASGGGIAFGIKNGENCDISQYEFSLYAVTDSNGDLGWATRVYKRVTNLAEGFSDKGYVCAGSNTKVNSLVNIELNKTFNVKVIVNGLNASCYVDDVEVLSFTVTDTGDANYARGAIVGGAGVMRFKNTGTYIDNIKMYKQEYLGLKQNFDNLGSDPNTALMNEGWYASVGYGNKIASHPLAAGIGSSIRDGKYVLPAGRVLSIPQYSNVYVRDPYALADYTFETEITISSKEGVTDYTYSGIGFGNQKFYDANNTWTNNKGFEFCVHPKADSNGDIQWFFRVYNRADGKHYIAEKAITGVDLALDKAFTMKVVLDDARAYCYINDVCLGTFKADAEITGIPVLMSTGTASVGNEVIFDNVALYWPEYVTYEENFDSLTASSNINNVWTQLDGLNTAWYADATTSNATLGGLGQFRAFRIDEDGSNKFLSTYHANYSVLFDTESHDSDYEFSVNLIMSGKGTDGAQKATVNGDFFGVLFGLQDVDTSDAIKLSGFEFMLYYNTSKWQARLYNRVNNKLTPATAWVDIPAAVTNKINNNEAVNFKVALDGNRAYCYLDNMPIIVHDAAETISGDIGIAANSAASTADRVLWNIDDFKFQSKSSSKINYLNVLESSAISLHGVGYDETEQVFNRMDLSVAEEIAGSKDFSKTSVYSHAREAAGGRIRFNTNSAYVTIKATVDYKDTTYAPAMNNGQFGFDIYVDTADGSTYVGTAAPKSKPTTAGELTYEATIYLGETVSRDLTIYFPLTIEVKNVQIGVASDAVVSEHSIPYADEHIVYYGCSVTQGGVVTKPGNSYANIIGRELNVEYTNLGVWGAALGQQTFAKYIADMDEMTVFVMDYDHNTHSVKELENTHYSFYETVRAAHPDIPIIMISRTDNNIGNVEGSTVSAYELKEVIIASYNKAKAAGDKNVHFIDGEQFFGYSNAYLPDKVHPNDAGHAIMAEVIGGVITRVLNGEKNVFVGETPDVSVANWNLSLGDNIGMNFYLQIADDAQDAKICITFDGETTEYTVDELTATADGYKISVELAAAQVTKAVKVEALQGETVIVSETYTIEQYANYILDDQTGKYDDVTKALVVELLNYCDKAQTYFEYNTDNRVSVDFSNTGKVEVSNAGVADIAVAGSVNGVQFYGASMVFESKNAVRFYFTGDLTGSKIYNGDAELEIQTKGTMYYVEVADINPDKLAEVITITVENGTQALTVSYSPMNYIVRMSQKGSENLQALLKALYNYHLAAVDYVQK